ncbi:MAG: radical SAM protein [Caldilineaceae bacterium]|nr:radical SAM protein [Caldilineaceae bacterium]
MARRPGEQLVEWLLAITLALVGLGERLRRSRMGYANPRVAHLVGALGYHTHSYRVGLPQAKRWLQTRAELFPAVVQVQTINRCNASCRMCPYPITWGLEAREVMDDALYSKIAAECAAAPELHDFVPMAQNEPLLDLKLAARIAEFKAQAQPHQMVELVTNGSALTLARFQVLSDAGLDLLTISANAASEATYQQVMGGLKWSRLVELLESLRQAGSPQVNVYLRFVKQRENSQEARAFVRRWQRHFNLMMYDVNNRAGAVTGYAQVATVKHALTRRLRRWLGPRLFKVCPYVFSIMAVMQNGDVLLCGNDWQERDVVGNVRQASLRAIYNSPRMQEVRELMRQGRYDEIAPCRNCSFRQEWL